jgi:tetratricopeptide (TPR) repeat protein
MLILSKFSLIAVLILASCTTLDEKNTVDDGSKLEDMVNGEIAIAENLLSSGKAEKAWQNLRPLLAQYPQRVDILTLAGLSLLALQNNARAQQLLQKAYQLKPSTVAGLNLSSSYIAAGQYTQAKELLLTLVAQKEPYNYKERLWHNLALIYEQEGDVDQAIATYELAIKENPTYYLSHLHLAKLYKRERSKKLATDYFARAHRYCPECYEPIEEMVDALRQKHRDQEAKALLNTYLQTEDGNLENRQKAQDLLQELKGHTRKEIPLVVD